MPAGALANLWQHNDNLPIIEKSAATNNGDRKSCIIDACLAPFMKKIFHSVCWQLLGLALGAGVAGGAGTDDAGAELATALPMLRTVPGSGFTAEVLFTTGDRIGDYQPPGVMDGMVAFPGRDSTAVTLLVTHELAARQGRPYRLDNGTTLTGSRVTRFELDKRTGRITGAGLAYREIRDRSGRIVSDPVQVSEQAGGGSAGLESFCSAAGWSSGQFGFVDRIMFAHEEVTSLEGHPHGGTIYALDVHSETLWALPELGRGSWENSAALNTPDGAEADGHVALLLGDDLEFGGAPLYLWIGRKIPGGNFIERNGLASGQLHVWVADSGDRNPQQWSGSGSTRNGHFVPLTSRSPAGLAGPGTDAAGYFDDAELRRRAEALGAFMFSRPEDLATNPRNGSQAVFASTGHGDKFPADDWGSVYVVEASFAQEKKGSLNAAARLRLLYDSDETDDLSLRNPDNLVWATDGLIYVQEDKATKRGAFGEKSGREASIWVLDPGGSSAPRAIATVDRKAVPRGSTDSKAQQFGAWESSGVTDVTALLGGGQDALVLLVDVQAHGVIDGPVGGHAGLVEGGQLLRLSKSIGP